MDDSIPSADRRELLHTVGAAGLIGLAGCSEGGSSGSDGTETTGDESETTDGESSETGGQGTVNAAWAYLTQPGDHGWTYQHDQAVQAVDEKFDWLEVSTVEGVSNEDVGRVMQEFANGDQDIIFGSSFGYMDPMYETAEQNPDTIFEHCAGFRSRENMGRYFVHMDQTYFLAGIAAGMMTESDTLGFLAPFPIAEVLRFVNAFAIGAALDNENATIEVRWMNTWFDPAKAKQAAKSLIDVGADVVTGAMDSPATVEAAAAEDVWCIGANSPMAEFGGDSYVTSVVYNWEPFYTQTLEAVRAGNWESDFHWGDIGENAVSLDEWGPQVPDDVKSAVETEKQALVDGERTIWQGSKFEGESDSFLFQEMNSLVPQVDAEIP